MIDVDVLTVLGPGMSVHDRVLSALKNQGDVNLKHYIVEGQALLPGEDRITAIAKARNCAKELGDSHYAMFLDYDVVLPPSGIEKLVYALILNPYYAAIGIDYQNIFQPSVLNIHVAMGSVLFIRPILQKIVFRTEPGKCECYCCCEDIRQMGYLIGYLPDLRAEHIK